MSSMEEKRELTDVPPLCQVCGLHERQYKCPRCSILSCSLVCCKKHKAESGCNGKREPSTFKNLHEMSANDLQRDYHFLENVLSRKDGAKRTLSQSCGGTYDSGGKGNGGRKKRQNTNAKRARVDLSALATKEATPQNLEVHKPSVQRLVKASWDRKCYLSVMPPGMSRREKNSSRYMPKSDTILWRLQIVFVAQEGAAKIPSDLLQPTLETTSEGELTSSKGLVGLSYEAIDEKLSITEILAPLIGQVSSGEGKYEAQRHALRYLRLHRSDVVCMLQKIPSPSSKPVFAEVDEALRLRDALEERSVLEFPALFVGLTSDMAHLQRNIEDIPFVTEAVEAEDGDKGKDKDEDEDGDEEDEEDEEEEDGEGFIEALQEMGTKPIQDLQRIIAEQSS